LTKRFPHVILLLDFSVAAATLCGCYEALFFKMGILRLGGVGNVDVSCLPRPDQKKDQAGQKVFKGIFEK
jgi:hypothetical protein